MALRITEAQIAFLSVCVADPKGQNLRPGSFAEATGVPVPRAKSNAWHRTARALIAKALVTQEAPFGYITATITQAGRDALGHAVMNKKVANFDVWKLGCIAVVLDVGLPVDDLWAKDDPYDLFAAADEAFKGKVTPMSFIDETFAEDLARLAYDEHLQDEALQHEFGEG